MKITEKKLKSIVSEVLQEAGGDNDAALEVMHELFDALRERATGSLSADVFGSYMRGRTFTVELADGHNVEFTATVRRPLSPRG